MQEKLFCVFGLDNFFLTDVVVIFLRKWIIKEKTNKMDFIKS